MKKKARPAKKHLKLLTHRNVLFIVLGAFMGFFLPALLGTFYLQNKPQLCANSISCIQDVTGVFDPQQKKATFMGKTIVVPEPVTIAKAETKVLGDTEGGGEKVIKIDLSKQTLYAYEGDKLIHEFLVSTGKWGRTPTGEFRTWIKLRATRMKGGNRELGTFYDLPNVQYTMFFSNDQIPKSRGYGIHGAYWHDNFGHPMSHGCINMRTEEAGIIYEWANPPTEAYTTYATKDNPGTKIIIYGEAPLE